MKTETALPAHEQALALATKRAVQAAGGVELCAGETAAGTSQISRCCSGNHRDSITVRDAVTIDAMGHGTEGHPFILRAQARQLGFVVISLPEAGACPDGLMQTAMDMTVELGDVVGSIRTALADGECSAKEALHALIELDELDEKSAALRLRLKQIAEPSAPAVPE